MSVGAATRDYARVDDNLAANLRASREAQGLSQDEVAQRMSERGFGFSQATVWKIEQGKRPVKISEAMALAEVVGYYTWTSLLTDPDSARLDLQVQSAHHRAAQAYQAIATATKEFLHRQAEVGIAAFEAREAGVPVAELWTSWLTEAPERAVIRARVEWQSEDARELQIDDAVDAILAASRENGYDPFVDIDAIEKDG